MSMPLQRPDKLAPSWLVWSALWVVYIVWGSTYLAIRVVVETMPPLLAGGARFLVAGALMYAWLRFRRGAEGVRITRREIGGATLVGTALLLGGNGLVSLAERDVPSGLTALIIASVPLWVVLFRTVFGDRVGVGTLIGVAVGFAGVALLVVPSGGSGQVALTGLLTVVLASFFWAGGSYFSKRLSLPDDPFSSTTWQMLLGGAVMTLVGVVSGEATAIDPAVFSTSSMVALAYLIVAGSLLAFTAYTWLLQHAPISKVATYAYVNPVIAIFLGWALLSEAVTMTIALGATVIVASVAFVVRHESRTPSAVAPEPAAGPATAAALKDEPTMSTKNA